MERDQFLIHEYTRQIDKYHRMWWNSGCTIYKQWADGYITMLEDLKQKIIDNE